jgi:uncharacterized membrane protein YqaE (UPF0057 family)
MTDNNPANVNFTNPDDLIYVSAKNLARKQNIEEGDSQIGGSLGRPGVITGLILMALDIVSTFTLKLSIMLLQVATFGYDWMNNMIFGNFKGIFPSSWTQGYVVSLKWFRYLMTILMPPFGVFLSKGCYGWFNVIICLALTYIHYLAGIIYAFVITVRNRYADQYEKRELAIATVNNPVQSATDDVQAFLYMCGFFGILISVIIFFLSIF